MSEQLSNVLIRRATARAALNGPIRIYTARDGIGRKQLVESIAMVKYYCLRDKARGLVKHDRIIDGNPRADALMIQEQAKLNVWLHLLEYAIREARRK